MFLGMNDAQRRAAQKRRRRFHSRMGRLLDHHGHAVTHGDTIASGVTRQLIAELLDEALRKGVRP